MNYQRFEKLSEAKPQETMSPTIKSSKLKKDFTLYTPGSNVNYCSKGMLSRKVFVSLVSYLYSNFYQRHENVEIHWNDIK